MRSDYHRFLVLFLFVLIIPLQNSQGNENENSVTDESNHKSRLSDTTYASNTAKVNESEYKVTPFQNSFLMNEELKARIDFADVFTAKKTFGQVETGLGENVPGEIKGDNSSAWLWVGIGIIVVHVGAYLLFADKENNSPWPESPDRP